MNVDTFRDILSYVDRDTLRGKRDYAILRLLWENALRREEVSQILITDYIPEEQAIWIQGKGRNQKEKLTLCPLEAGQIPSSQIKLTPAGLRLLK